jgi:error-prone DNA polymerase
VADRLGRLMVDYVPLWCKSHFSLLEGASHPEELMEQARCLGLRSLALTDSDSLAGAPRAAAAARQFGIKLIYGAELNLVGGRRAALLAKDRIGYGRLTQLLSRGRLRCTKGYSELSLLELCDAAPGCIALLGGDDGWLGASGSIKAAEVATLKEAFDGDLYLRISQHGCPQEQRRNQLLQSRARRFELPIVAANEHLYHHRSLRKLQDVLSCVRLGCNLENAGGRLRRNDQHGLESAVDFSARFESDPAWVEASLSIAERCNFDLFELRYRYPCERLPEGINGRGHLRDLAQNGAEKRYPKGVPSQVFEQLRRELELVGELEYEGYFLTMWEIVRFCREQEILCQGRGSAANSVLCYCLGITAVDPLQHDLLFERFLSRERSEPPDIDLDIAHQRREEVIQYVYEKYGRRYAAMVSVNIRYRRKSAIRDSGKALNIPINEVNALVKKSAGFSKDIPEKVLQKAGLDPQSLRVKLWCNLIAQMLDTPRHTSIHPGGFLLGHEPIDTLVPIENGAMAKRTVIQWDKNDIETLGLFKVDLLALGMLSQLQRCFELLRRYPPLKPASFLMSKDQDSLANIPADDKPTYAMLSQGRSLGVFQIESRAQMNMLPRLKPQCFYDLVVEVALIRPGPISGDMVHPYLRRRDGLEPVIYPHACLEPVLRRTLGIPLFQEQVMRIAMAAADYSPGEADQLRRDMAAWKRSGCIERHHQRLVSGMIAKGISETFAESVYAQIKGFGEYGFPESHAASFALISYATAFLKCHYPAHFYAALINAQPMGFYSISSLVYGAQREGVQLLPVDVYESPWDCKLESFGEGYALRMGLRVIKGLGSAQRILIEAAGAPLKGEQLACYARRLGLDKASLEALAEAGAFKSFGSRRQVLWQLSDPGLSRREPLILSEPEQSLNLPILDAFEQISWDQRASRHSARGHPFALLREPCAAQGFSSAAELYALDDKRRARCSGLVICRQRPHKASGVTFVTLEDETGFVNLVIWKKVAERFSAVLRDSALLAASGRVQKQGAVVHLIVHRLWEPAFESEIAPVPSYDYR